MKPYELDYLVSETKCAVVVVDVQNDFCHPEGVFGRRGADLTAVGLMMSKLNLLLDAARERNLPVVFVQNVEDEATDSDAWCHRPDGGEDIANEGVCRRGSWGGEIFGSGPRPGEAVVEKHRFSAFLGTGLDDLLREQGVNTVVLCGVATNVCVDTTAREAAMRDYNVIVAHDACGAFNPRLHENTLDNIRMFVGKVAGTAEISRKLVAAGRKKTGS